MSISSTPCPSDNPFKDYLLDHTLICAEAARLVSHMAVIMAHAMGNPGLGRRMKKRGQQSLALRADATKLLITWLDDHVLDLDLDSSMCDCAGQGPAKTAWTNYTTEWTTSHAGKVTPRYSAAFLPLDGAASLFQGRDGTMTWCAISSAHTFTKFTELNDKSYFVLAIGPSVLTDTRRRLAEGLAGTVAMNSAITLNEFLRTSEAITSICAGSQVLIAHTLELPHFRQARPFLGSYALGRWLDGSAVVAALAAFTKRTDFGYCVCRRETLPVIAAAARCAGGAALAVALDVGNVAQPANVKIIAGSPFIDVCALLPVSAHVVCAGASVTEICTSDRVRWGESPWRSPHQVAESPDKASQFITVHTLLLDTKTHMYEERITGWDIANVESFGEESLKDLVDKHRTRWKTDYDWFAAQPSQPDDSSAQPSSAPAPVQQPPDYSAMHVKSPARPRSLKKKVRPNPSH